MDMSNFKHRRMQIDRLDTNRMVSIMSKRQSLSPTAQAAVKAGIAASNAIATTSGMGALHLLNGPSFNMAIAEFLTELKGS
jgi:hypothetical protein